MIYYIGLELLLIISYLYKQMVFGIIIWCIIVAILYKKRKNRLDLLIKCLIASVPISYLEITCEVGYHIFKIYNFIILLLILYLLNVIHKAHMTVNKSILLASIGILSTQLIRTLFCTDLPSAFIELIQEYITVFTIGLFAIYIINVHKFTNVHFNVNEWLDLYYYTTVSASLGVIYQFLIYNTSGTRIGYTTIWLGRQVFDLLFTGYSVLTVYIGGGIIIAISKLLKGDTAIFHLFSLTITGFACAINSSRSGLLSAILIVLIMFVVALLKKKTIRYALLYGAPVFFLMAYLVSFLIRHRQSLQGGSLFFANNRDVVAHYAFEQMFNNALYFLFGKGINSPKIEGVSQHNMFLEMWTLNGTIFLLAFVVVVIAIVYKTKNKKERYLLWHILIAHQFISSLFASTFIVPILLIVLCSEDEVNKERQKILQQI